VNRGNVLDLQHFPDTYNQIKSKLKIGSLIIFGRQLLCDWCFKPPECQ
jgi:transposase